MTIYKAFTKFESGNIESIQSRTALGVFQKFIGLQHVNEETGVGKSDRRGDAVEHWLTNPSSVNTILGLGLPGFRHSNRSPSPRLQADFESVVRSRPKQLFLWTITSRRSPRPPPLKKVSFRIRCRRLLLVPPSSQPRFNPLPFLKEQEARAFPVLPLRALVPHNEMEATVLQPSVYAMFFSFFHRRRILSLCRMAR